MNEIDELVSDIRKLLDKQLQKTFEAGREDMRREVSQLLGHRLLKGHIHSMARKPNGTVRPRIIELVKNCPGMLAAQITEKTGFKDNSVRATLTTLRNEGLMEKRDDLWFFVTKRDN